MTTKGHLDLTFTGQAVLKHMETGKTLRLLSFRVRGQNMSPPAELVLSLQALPVSLKTLAPEPHFIEDGKWVHYTMKSEALASHPELFEHPESPDYLEKNLDVLLDLNLYEILLPEALVS